MRFRDKREQEKKATERAKERARELMNGSGERAHDDPRNGTYLSNLEKLDPSEARTKCLVIGISRLARLETGMSVEQHASLAGISADQIIDFEAGNAPLTPEQIEDLLFVLPVSFEEKKNCEKDGDDQFNIYIGEPPPWANPVRRTSNSVRLTQRAWDPERGYPNSPWVDPKDPEEQCPTKGEWTKMWKIKDPDTYDALIALLIITREARKGAGFSRAELAKRVGITEEEMLNYENGEAPVSGRVYQLLKQILKITIKCDPSDEYIRERRPGIGITVDMRGRQHAKN